MTSPIEESKNFLPRKRHVDLLLYYFPYNIINDTAIVVGSRTPHELVIIFEPPRPKAIISIICHCTPAVLIKSIDTQYRSEPVNMHVGDGVAHFPRRLDFTVTRLLSRSLLNGNTNRTEGERDDVD